MFGKHRKFCVEEKMRGFTECLNSDYILYITDRIVKESIDVFKEDHPIWSDSDMQEIVRIVAKCAKSTVRQFPSRLPSLNYIHLRFEIFQHFIDLRDEYPGLKRENFMFQAHEATSSQAFINEFKVLFIQHVLSLTREGEHVKSRGCDWNSFPNIYHNLCGKDEERLRAILKRIALATPLPEADTTHEVAEQPAVPESELRP